MKVRELIKQLSEIAIQDLEVQYLEVSDRNNFFEIHFIDIGKDDKGRDIIRLM